MAPVVNSDSGTMSPCSPPRKKAKFSLRLKGKKMKIEEEEKPKSHNVYSIFDSPHEGNDENRDENNSLREPEIQALPHAGLLNQGNTCYANAVLQVLRCCTGFEQLVRCLANKEKDLKNYKQVAEQKDETEQLISQLDELLCKMCTFEEDFLEDKENCIHLSSKGNNLVLAAEPFNFMEAFRELYPAFEVTLQHDAQEFLCSLIMALAESAANKAKHKTNSTNCLPEGTHSKSSESNCDVVMTSDSSSCSMERLFQGKLVHQTKCLNCEESKLRYEDFQDVSVPVVEDQPYLDARKKLMLSPTPKKNKDSVHTMQWAITQFASSECLQGDNKYFCEKCNTYCEAEIRTCFDKLPVILTIHLKRFTSSVGLSSKITSNLQTPFILSVQEWCSKKCRLESNVYELFGIVVHSGMTSGSGHYETYVRLTDDQDKNYAEPLVIGSEDCFEKKVGEKCRKTRAARDNGIVQNDMSKDINGNCVFEEKEEREEEPKIIGKRKSKRNTKEDDGIRQMENDTDVTEKTTVGIKELKRKREDRDITSTNGCASSETVQSPIEKQPQAQTSCMSVITRYFQRSRKVSSGTRSENRVQTRSSTKKKESLKEDDNSTLSMDMDTDERNLQENRSENQENESSSKAEPINPNVYGSIESFFKKTVLSQSGLNNSKSPAIRKLNFQGNLDVGMICNENSEQSKGSNGYQSNSSDEDVQITNSSSHCAESLKTGWVHFDDCIVNPLSEQDILSILSSSDSSFSSPYLLFYRKISLT